LDRQRDDGNWAHPAGDSDKGVLLARTCFALLALEDFARPIAIARLSTSDEVEFASRDAANLAGFISRQHRPVSWQAVPSGADPNDLDHPAVLYVHWTQTPTASDQELIARAAAGGALVLVQPMRGDEMLGAAAAGKLGRWLALAPIRPEADHPLFRARYEIAPRPVMLLGDGGMIRGIVLTEDLSRLWHHGGRSRAVAEAMRFGANIVTYAAGGALPPSRFDPPAGPAPPPAATTVAVARLRHGGDWNVNPGAWPALDATCRRAWRVGLDVRPAVDLAAPPDGVELLLATGTAGLELDGDRRAELRAWIGAGGTAVFCPAYGHGRFGRSARAVLSATFGPTSLAAIPDDHPFRTGELAGGLGADLRGLAVPPTTPGEPPRPVKLWGVTHRGRLAVVFCEAGVTAGCEGRSVYRRPTLEPSSARRLLANVVLLAGAASGR
jgi:hypothetical protein